MFLLVVVGGAGVLAGENGCGVSICWFPKKLESPEMLCWLSSLVAEATEGPACWSSTNRKEIDCPLVCCCCPLLATGGWMTWVAGICVSGMVKMPSLAVGAGGC